jgi:hypothetical protein
VTAAIAGLGLGALHAVTGPDHVLSLAPAAVARRGAAWRPGLSWGAGHALGTAAWLAVAALAAALVEAPRLEGLADRVAGIALALTGAAALGRSWRTRAPRPGGSDARPAFWLGALHGLTGAAGVLILLPAVAAGGPERVLWLLGFSAGSTAAMAGLTAALASLGGRLPATFVRWTPRIAGTASIALGIAWGLA